MDDKVLQSVLSGQRDNNIRFQDLRTLLLQMGFAERIKGDHFIYKRAGCPERINIQPDGNMAKGYQVRQVRNLIQKYRLEFEF
ncbi:MAG: type II toxin-antitoxin system HicA family toxin [Oscillospiraceae bacterium]|nr:type II toxin-antitoxin system HicA family toxin [Oscillospiraceae bacterium]